jgi:hypothetical protein
LELGGWLMARTILLRTALGAQGTRVAKTLGFYL